MLGPSGSREDDAPARDRRAPAGRTPDACCSTGSISRTCRRTGAASASCSRITRSSRIATSSGTSPSGCACAATRPDAIDGASRRAARARRPRRVRAALGRRRSRAASSSASRSRERSRRSRASSSSTSRSGRSTGGCATGCSTISQRCSTSSRVTAVYVTHDQAEAFTLGDRVAVMRAGRVVQVGDAGRALGAPAGRGRRSLPRASRTSRDGEVVRPEAVTVRAAAGAGDGVVERGRPRTARSCASSSGSTTGATLEASSPRSTIRAPATGSTSRSTRKASFASVIRRRVVVHGLVQGVFFRETTRRRARVRGCRRLGAGTGRRDRRGGLRGRARGRRAARHALSRGAARRARRSGRGRGRAARGARRLRDRR